jgi:hypothetical protein
MEHQKLYIRLRRIKGLVVAPLVSVLVLLLQSPPILAPQVQDLSPLVLPSQHYAIVHLGRE